VGLRMVTFQILGNLGRGVRYESNSAYGEADTPILSGARKSENRIDVERVVIGLTDHAFSRGKIECSQM
jgi:hypothetical protein